VSTSNLNSNQIYHLPCLSTITSCYCPSCAPSAPRSAWTRPIELVSLQTQNDADGLPSFVEYFCDNDPNLPGEVYYYITKLHGVKRRRWNSAKSWFSKDRYWPVNWNEYLMV